jgi:hypothetical protein
MKLILEDMFTKQYYPAFKRWNQKLKKIIREYDICTDTTENEYGEIELWCYDNDLAKLFSDSGIGVGISSDVAKEFKYDGNFQPVGLRYGDYIETVELKQNGKTYLVPVYCAYNGIGADYGMAIFEATKKEYSKGE